MASEDEGDVEELRGEVVDGELVLVCSRTGVVYDSERDEGGNLVRIGVWQCDSKTVAKDQVEENSGQSTALSGSVSGEVHTTKQSDAHAPVALSFLADEDDHCETAPEAYRHVVPILDAIATSLGKTRKELSIYDPYFCQGAVVRNLAGLGFENVFNRNVDFYETIAQKQIPPHDVLVTNPPYSGDHVERILEFCCGGNPQGKCVPWLLLVPNWSYTKAYYGPITARSHVMYVAPTKRYCYWAPKQMRQDKKLTHTVASLGKRTSPFVSFWHVGNLPSPLRASLLHSYPTTVAPTDAVLVARTELLPLNSLDSSDPRRKRKRKKQRDAERRRTEVVKGVTGEIERSSVQSKKHKRPEDGPGPAQQQGEGANKSAQKKRKKGTNVD